MCMRATEEGCILQEQLQEVKETTANLDSRLTKVEGEVGKMRTETADGFRQGAETMRQINESVANLAHDFGQRMNNFDKRFVEEKEKWGETLRKILTWGAKALILGALAAMGINVLNDVIKTYFGG